MVEVEGVEHSWVTGFYWVLTVMSTLGFGDITFQSDVGRLFSIVVLVTGIVMLLIVLPFAFIRFFYAPWLEAQIRIPGPSDRVEPRRSDEYERRAHPCVMWRPTSR
jgi:voltage-gated potassium channel